MPGVEIGGSEGGAAGRVRRAAARTVDAVQRVGRGIVDRFRRR